MRLLVCGGRNFNNVELLRKTLTNLEETYGVVTLLIHGNASGADSLADGWANENDVEVLQVPADWRKYGKAAGPIRNAEMLRHEPDLVVAFAGGKGTRNMIQLARDAGIEVIDVV